MSRVGDAPSIAVASRDGAGGDGVEEEVAVGGGRGVEGGEGEAEEEEAGAELVDLPLELLLRLAGLIVALLEGPGVLLVVPFLARMAPHLRSSSKRRPTSPPRYQGSLFRAAVATRTGGGFEGWEWEWEGITWACLTALSEFVCGPKLTVPMVARPTDEHRFSHFHEKFVNIAQKNEKFVN
ncbi:unnamed protein product [Miscanthus lutarioriparius]|uniref:Uncharacterized protein n=1 Tax=Miscanthus lutarioriparius TaxID=422564 RepID=A0A811NAI0_9POAL|nr:unnamed protein product [Miscanthus lutarioriparius]